MANLLMMSIGQFASRFVGPTSELRPPSNFAQYKSYKWLEADPITLAKGGVYYAGDWSHLKLARADKIFQIIEYSRVVVEGSSLTCPLDAAIWAHWQSFKYNSKEQQTFNKIVK